MAVIALTDEVAAYVAELVIGQQTFDLQESSAVTGDTAVRVYAPPRWTVSIRALDSMPRSISERWNSILLRLVGRRNHFAVWDINAPLPRGTARGTLLTSGTTAAGATTLNVSGGTAGDTLVVGDWLQVGTGVGSQVVKCVSGLTIDGSGNGSTTFTPPLRKAVSSGTTITLEKPLFHLRSISASTSWTATPGATDSGGQLFQGAEDWNP